MTRGIKYNAQPNSGKMGNILKGGKTMEKKGGYIGKITNAGAQKVRAPISNSGKKGNATVKKSEDLRTGK